MKVVLAAARDLKAWSLGALDPPCLCCTDVGRATRR